MKYLRWHQLATSNEIRGVELKQIGSDKKSSGRPFLGQTHKDKRKVWARDNMKTDFGKVTVYLLTKAGSCWMGLMVGRKVGFYKTGKHQSARDDRKVGVAL